MDGYTYSNSEPLNPIFFTLISDIFQIVVVMWLAICDDHHDFFDPWPCSSLCCKGLFPLENKQHQVRILYKDYNFLCLNWHTENNDY